MAMSLFVADYHRCLRTNVTAVTAEPQLLNMVVVPYLWGHHAAILYNDSTVQFPGSGVWVDMS